MDDEIFRNRQIDDKFSISKFNVLFKTFPFAAGDIGNKEIDAFLVEIQ